MSIISDALARLQAERARRLKGRFSDPSAVSGLPGSAESPPLPRRASDTVFARRWRVTLISALLLFCLGIGSYWWGLTLVSETPQVDSSLRSVISETPSDVPPVVAESVPAPAEEKTITDSESLLPSDGQAAIPPTESATSVAEPGIDSTASKPIEETAESVDAVSPPEEATIAQATPSPVDKPAASIIQPAQADQTTPVGDGRQLDKGESKRDKVPVESRREPSSVQAKKPVSSNGKQERVMEQPRPRKPLSPERRLTLAQGLIKSQDYARAVALLTPLINASPQEWEPWFWMGTAELGLGNMDEADRYFIEGLARNSTVPELWVQRALVVQQRGNYAESVELLRQAEILAPDLPEVALNLGYSLDGMERRDAALRYYQRFLTLTEGNPAYLSARKMVLQRVSALSQT